MTFHVAVDGGSNLDRQHPISHSEDNRPARLGHTRQRSTSWGATTYYSSTILPAKAQPDAQVLSTLISSLTAFHEQAVVKPIQLPLSAQSPNFDDTDALQPLDTIAISSDFQHDFYNDQIDLAESDDSSAPAPVAGYTTTLPLSRPRTPISDRWPSTKIFKRSRQDLRPTKSSWSLRHPHTLNNNSKDIGLPSIERPFDDSDSSVRFPIERKKSQSKSPFKMFFTTRHGDEHVRSIRSNTPKRSLQGSPPADSSSILNKDGDRDDCAMTTSSAGDRRLSTTSDVHTTDSRPPIALSPSSREDLEDHLIPSRRSSLRLSLSHNKRSSISSADPKMSNLDQDLLEEDDSTVRRIRELRRAKEQRHSEWRKEARRGEKHPKRVSMPNTSPVKQGNKLRSSWQSQAVVESAQEDESPMEKLANAGQRSDMSAFTEADRSHAPFVPFEPTPDLRRNPSISPSTTQSLTSTKQHRKRLSDSFRRSPSVRRPAIDDAKAIGDEVEAFLSAPRLTQRIRHPRTGRTIAFSEVGDPDGFVVFCCVGMGLTRYVTTFYDELAKTHKLRLITPDRPGVGESQAFLENASTPLGWVDDVAVICSSLGVEKFSLLAHSAGAIYALAVALKMPQYVRGRIHLLAPWIPPSQLAASGTAGDVKAANLPTSHKILSFLPTSFMKAANSRFLVATSASIEPRPKKDRKKDRASALDLVLDSELFDAESSLTLADMGSSSMLPTPETTPTEAKPPSCYQAQTNHLGLRSPPMSPTPGSEHRHSTVSPPPRNGTPVTQSVIVLTPQARAKLFNATLTRRTWALATLNANPAVDLIVCLERRRPIGFRYTDIGRAVVIHHGENDTRVPLDNVKWLSTAMKRCELRVLENEGHGLMASATVMSNVLAEIGKEWEEWNKIAREQEKRRRETEEEEQRRRERDMRRGRW